MFVRNRRCILGCSTALTSHCVVTLVVRFAVAKPTSHFSARVLGGILFLLDDDMELMFTLSINDDVKASIVTLGSEGWAMSLDGLGGRGAWIPRTFLLGFFLVLIYPFQFVIAFSCSA